MSKKHFLNTQRKILIVFLLGLTLVLLMKDVALGSNRQGDVEPVSLRASNFGTIEKFEPPEGTFKKVSLRILIEEYLYEEGIAEHLIAYSIQDFVTGSLWSHNAKIPMIGASVYKFPLAMLFYDEINQNNLEPDTLIPFDWWMAGEGGVIEESYWPGTLVPLDEVLYELITYSDNAAGHMLYTYFGGWEQMRDATLRYTKQTPQNWFYLGDNFLTTRYVSDVLNYLYYHQSDYEYLLSDMLQSQPRDYLNYHLDGLIYQKMGAFEEMSNSAGLVLEGNPFSIVVFTKLGDDGAKVMGDIALMTYRYLNEEGFEKSKRPLAAAD